MFQVKLEHQTKRTKYASKLQNQTVMVSLVWWFKPKGRRSNLDHVELEQNTPPQTGVESINLRRMTKPYIPFECTPDSSIRG